MIGTKDREFKTHAEISLDNLVPEDNFYRQLETCVNLEFIRELVQELYSNLGRPSIDPAVFFKLQLIAFFEGVRSERQLMEMVNLNLAHRWYIGYDLDEPVPDHSSLSKIRDRYGLKIFQLFFEKIVEQCIAAGLVWGAELYFDATKVRANADINGMVEQSETEAEQHLEELFPSNQDTDSALSSRNTMANGSPDHARSIIGEWRMARSAPPIRMPLPCHLPKGDQRYLVIETITLSMGARTESF